MKRLMALVGVAAFALALTGCSQPVVPTVKPHPSPTSVTKSASPVDWDTCKTFASQLQPYADFILAASGGHVDSAALANMREYIGTLRTESSPAIAGKVTDYAVPYDAIDAAVKGNGQLSFNSTGFKSASLQIMQYCADVVGYKVSQ